MNKQAQTNLLDLLLRIMPELKGRMIPGNRMTHSKAAKALYTIWSDESSKVAANKFRKPDTLTYADVKMLETEGLVTSGGDALVITAKGGDVIRQMILGDNRSVFDDDKFPTPDYLTALSNLQPSRRKTAKIASAEPRAPVGRNWYTALKHDDTNR